MTRVEPAGVRHDWGLGSPGPGISRDNFSARIEGNFTFAEGPYRFSVTFDDGIRLYVDGKLVLESWEDNPARTRIEDIHMTAGLHNVRLEYYERGEQATLWVRWQPLNTATTPVQANPNILPWPDTVPGLNLYTAETKQQLHRAINYLDTATVYELISSLGYPRFYFTQGINQTPFHFAVQRDALEIVQLMLSHPEADPNVRYDHANEGRFNSNRTPLQEAAGSGYGLMVELLLSNGADHSLTTDSGHTALHMAARANRPETIEILLAHGADPNVREFEYGGTPLHETMGWNPFGKKEETDALEALLRHRRTDPNARDDDRRTPLHRAVLWKRPNALELLLSHLDIKPNRRDDQGATALYWAAAKGHYTMVRALLDHRETDPDIETDSGWTPLQIALREGYTDIAAALRKEGASQ